MTRFRIDVVSDPICPWCYIGKGRLERAIDLYKSTVPDGDKDTFTVTWHPFYLNPDLPKEGVDSLTQLTAKYGAVRARMMLARVRAIGEAEGLNFGAIGKRGNTRDAHRLVQLGRSKSVATQNSVVTEVFNSHFGAGGDVTDRDMLVNAGMKAGLDRDEVTKWLDEGQGGDEVDRAVEEAVQRRIRGVPNFTINEKYTLEGAQEPETFVEVFMRAKMAAESHGVSEGGACQIA